MTESIMPLHQQQLQEFSSHHSTSDIHSIENTSRLSYEASMLSCTVTGASGGKPEACTEYGDSSTSPFLVIPRSEYDCIRHELVDLKQSIAKLRHRVKNDLDFLKSESQMLKYQVSKCTCACSANEINSTTYSDNHRSGCWTTDAAAWEVDQPDRLHVDMCYRSPSKTSNDVKCCGRLSSPSYTASNTSDNALHSPEFERGRLVQLLPNYDVWVNKLNVQIVVNEAASRKTGAALFILRRVIPLVFTWDELACSRGQGLNCRTTTDMFAKLPLDPVKVAACKAFMRKFCADCDCPEPGERSINQTFSHQINYARRRRKSPATALLDVKPSVFLHDEDIDSDANLSSEKDAERYIQM